MDDPSLIQNRCFLYHLIGNGTGEWRVPIGGMGAVTDALAKAAVEAGAEIITGAGVSAITPGPDGAEVVWHDGDGQHSVTGRRVLSGVAPWVLRILLGEGEDAETKPSGSQLKINFLLDRLPALKSGADPEVAFAGTLHLAEDYTQLERAYDAAAGGQVPDPMPGEVYCHSLTDPSILGDRAGSAHTLTYFGLHVPADLFDADPGRPRRRHRGGRSPRSTRCSPSRSRTASRPTPTATRASRRRSRRTSRRTSRCRAATSSTATSSGPGHPTGRASTPPPSSGACRPSTTPCCSADRARGAAGRCPDSAGTTPRRRSSRTSEAARDPDFACPRRAVMFYSLHRMRH